MEQIRSISISRIGKGAHWTFVNNMLNLANEYETLTEKAGVQIAALTRAFQEESEHMNSERKSLLTGEIKDADRRRDRLYGGLKNIIKGNLQNPDAEKAEAAKTLSHSAKSIGVKTRTFYDSESGYMERLIMVFKRDYAAEVELLELGGFMAALEAAENDMTRLVHDRTVERSVIVNGAWKKARLDTDAAYRAFVKTVNAYAVIEGDGVFSDFITRMNAIINRYKRVLKGYAKGKDDGSGENADENALAALNEQAGSGSVDDEADAEVDAKA